MNRTNAGRNAATLQVENAALKARVKELEAAINSALKCKPSIKHDPSGLRWGPIIYDCGDPWDTLRQALTALAWIAVLYLIKIGAEFAAMFNEGMIP